MNNRLPWFPAGLRNDHAGPLNAEVHRTLIGIYRADTFAETLVELLRSEEEMDRHTRSALADAIEADLKGDKNALRLHVKKPAHRSRTRLDVGEYIAEVQEIAALYQVFREEMGMTWDQAAHEFKQLGYGKSKLSEALDLADKIPVRVTFTPRKSATSSE